MKIRNMVIGGLAGIVLGLTACDPDDPPTSDSGYDASSDAGNPDGGPPDSGYDGGLDAGYDAGNPDGGNDGIEVYLETRNNITNQPQVTFQVREMVRFYTKAKDTKCDESNSCNNSNDQNTSGIKYCIFSDDIGNSGTCSIDSNGECLDDHSYANIGNRNAKITCIVRRNNQSIESKPIEFQIIN